MGDCVSKESGGQRFQDVEPTGSEPNPKKDRLKIDYIYIFIFHIVLLSLYTFFFNPEIRMQILNLYTNECIHTYWTCG